MIPLLSHFMKKSLSSLLVFALAFPLLGAAFDYTDVSKTYTDAPFSTAEAAGISFLTHLGVVSGNPDGSFRPGRSLNRAEFTKIALLSAGIDPNDATPANCFPDVRATDWFSPYVCEAKKRGIIGGYPDGFFRPEQSVNYVEALKILVKLYGYSTAQQPNEQWYMQYVRAAQERGTLLPVNIQYGELLTRGQMARLASGFIALQSGELAAYRRVENGLPPFSSSSSSSSSSISSSSSSSSSSNSSSSSSSSSVPLSTFPARNHQLLLGTVRTDPLIGRGIMALQEDIVITRAEVDLYDNVDSIDALYLIDQFGNTVGQLTLDPYDTSDETWIGNFAGGSGAYRVPKTVERVFGIVARLKPYNEGGISGEHIRFDDFQITAQGVDSHTTYDTGVINFTPPEHDLVMSKITAVANADGENGALAPGTQRLIGSFTIAGTVLPTATLKATSLEFQLSKSPEVTVANWKLRATDTNVTLDCTVNGTTISCSGLPVELGIITNPPRILQLTGDITVAGGAQSPFLQVSLAQAGNYGTNGSIRWTDGVSTFAWVELASPLATGTLWR